MGTEGTVGTVGTEGTEVGNNVIVQRRGRRVRHDIWDVGDIRRRGGAGLISHVTRLFTSHHEILRETMW